VVGGGRWGKGRWRHACLHKKRRQSAVKCRPRTVANHATNGVDAQAKVSRAAICARRSDTARTR